MRRLCFSITVLLALVALKHNLRAEDAPFHLGHRAIDDLPQLTDEELGTPQQQALLQALYADPYAHRAADHQCSGSAMLVRRHAIPTNTRHYGGYWVGGGVPILGENPTIEEGVFGWDYFGMTFTKRVALNFTHGRRHQGGFGAYQTDGPRLHKR